MQPVKRIEIVSDGVELGKVLAALERAGVSSYTVVRNVAGKGVRGVYFDDSAVTMLDNAYVIAFCGSDRLTALAEQLRPVLQKFGGNCWISEAVELLSISDPPMTDDERA